MNNAPSVNCPTHGTHGALSNGRCWYCVQTGNATVIPCADVEYKELSEELPEKEKE